jgi:fumarate hydratase class II
MPGKRNPTIGEVVAQASFQVMGNYTTVCAAAAAGMFELNVAKPVIIYNVLQSIRILADSARMFGSRLIRDLDVDRGKLEANVVGALLLATALNPVIGYDKVAQITAKALGDGVTPREAAIALGFVTAEEYDLHVDPTRMALGYADRVGDPP